MRTFARAAFPVAFFAVLLVCGGAQAAGFDCGAAKSKAEHLICSDKSIDLLDDKLSDQYTATMAVAADQNGLVKSQRDWLKQRNACADAVCLKKSYQDRTAALAGVPHAGWQTYRDAKLGISFEYLGNRRVVPCPGGDRPDCVALVGRGVNASDYFIAFKLVAKPLEKAAADDADFVKQDGKWMTQDGPGAPQAVESFSGNGWQGLKSTITCGISDSLGFHAGAGDCFWAAMSNGKRSVVADTQGIVGTDADTMRSVSSFRFDR